jgi:hypothetical protein
MLNTIASFGVETWTKNTVWNISRTTNLKYAIATINISVINEGVIF